MKITPGTSEWNHLLQEIKSNNPQLTELDLSENEIDDAGAKELSLALKDNRSLRSLKLSRNQIGDAGAKALSQALKDNRTLTSLILFGNRIWPAGADALILAFKDNRSLTLLDIRANLIGPIQESDLKAIAIRNEDLRDALHQAVKTNNLSQVQSLCQQGANLLSISGNENNTPLHWAVHLGNVELIKWLIATMRQNQLPLTLRNKAGKTAADLVQENPILQTLFQAPSTSVTSTSSGFHATDSISSSSTSSNDSDSMLLTAAKKGLVKDVSTALQQSTNINYQNSKGWTALHYATRKGHMEVVKLLLHAQADTSLKTNKGHTAYDFAVEKKHVEIIKLLMPSHQQHQVISDKPSPGKQEVNKPVSPPAVHPTLPSPQLDAFHITYSQLTFEKELGKGGFGVVFKGTWRFNDVAIKQLHLTQPTPSALEEFQQEMHIMSKLRSPNIVQLYGVCAQQAPYCIVMEYMPKGSLYQVLHSNTELSWNIREQIATDIACGLAFLHEEKIVHRDLKSLNVLLDLQYKAKLSDFGLSRIKTETSSTTKNDSVGTLAWMAPELFKRRAVYTPKSDMYSYGMTVWELAARDIPFKDASNIALISKWVSEGEREEIPQGTPPKLAKIIKFCWETEPDKRPSAEQIVRELKAQAADNIHSQPAYRDNFNSTAHSTHQNRSKEDENSAGYRSNFHSFKP